MRIGLVSNVIFRPDATIDGVVEEAVDAEQRGFHFLSTPHVFGLDALTALAFAGRATQKIELATGVVPSPPRHPAALAQQALTVQTACDGRLVLGIGLSHKLVIEDLFGLSYAQPAKQMREYLEVLMPLVHGEPAAFSGDLYRVNTGIQVAGAAPVPVLVAALGPRMLDLTGRLADGTATWMTGPKTLDTHIVPRIRAGADAEGRPVPRVIAALPIALCSDRDQAREAAGKAFAMYGSLPSYRAMLDLEGAAGPGDVAILGDEAALRDALKRLNDSGVSDFAASCFEAEAGARDRTLAFLADAI